MVLYYRLWNYRSRGDATAAGAEALRAVAPISVEKNIVRIQQSQKLSDPPCPGEAMRRATFIISIIFMRMHCSVTYTPSPGYPAGIL